MRVVHVETKNFASYGDLTFDFSNQGLTLIQGPTGAGKSTLCDLIPWVLFGRTAKDGAADEVRSWQGVGPTYGNIQLDNGVSITRIRGNAKENDLYYSLTPGSPQRGKDLLDTQKRINELLNLTSDLYLASAYFHEFSQTAQFFTTTAKNRRIICEQIVDLALPKKLSLKASDWRKTSEKELKASAMQLESLEWKLKQTVDQLTKAKLRSNNWAMEQASKRQDIITKRNNFESDKLRALKTYQDAEVEYIRKANEDPRCSECGSIKKKDHNHKIHNPFAAKIDAVLSRQNNYIEQLDALALETNPHQEMYQELKETKDALTVEISDANIALSKLITITSDLEAITDATASLRSSLIITAIQAIEYSTNELLSKYFDAEIKVGFTVEDADKLDVVIAKDGNQCSYTQLSKGQRQMLKLCFGVSVMKQASNHSGVNLTQVFFDEALDGLDDILKLKAYKLLEALATEYESVFVVEHNAELKAVFPNTVKVQLVEGSSQIEQA